jgi:hypothetical protein
LGHENKKTYFKAGTADPKIGLLCAEAESANLAFHNLRILHDSSLDIPLNPVLTFLVMRAFFNQTKLFLRLFRRILAFVHSLSE